LCKEDTGRLDRAEGSPSVGTAREPAPYPKVRWRIGEGLARSGAATRSAAQDGARPLYHPGMVRPAIAPHALPELSARQLNRTTLLRQSLLERSAEDTTTAVRRLGGLQAQYANSPSSRSGRGWTRSRSATSSVPSTSARSSRRPWCGPRSNLGAFGPASDADIGKWIGQPRLPRIRAAIAALGDRIRSFRGPDGRDLVDLVDAPIASGDEPAPGRFLARWDEILIGCDRREQILPDDVAGEVVRRKNGAFLPSFTVDGLVAGTWSVTTTGAEAILELAPLIAVPAAARAGLAAEAERLVRFVAPAAGRHDVRWTAGR
jgi:hypothetical protein